MLHRSGKATRSAAVAVATWMLAGCGGGGGSSGAPQVETAVSAPAAGSSTTATPARALTTDPAPTGVSSDTSAGGTAPLDPNGGSAPSGSPAPAVPEALRFTAPLVGGGTIDAASLAGTPVLFWFWAPY